MDIAAQRCRCFDPFWAIPYFTDFLSGRQVPGMLPVVPRLWKGLVPALVRQARVGDALVVCLLL